jgi:hypothetical protein
MAWILRLWTLCLYKATSLQTQVRTVDAKKHQILPRQDMHMPIATIFMHAPSRQRMVEDRILHVPKLPHTAHCDRAWSSSHQYAIDDPKRSEIVSYSQQSQGSNHSITTLPQRGYLPLDHISPMTGNLLEMLALARL